MTVITEDEVTQIWERWEDSPFFISVQPVVTEKFRNFLEYSRCSFVQFFVIWQNILATAIQTSRLEDFGVSEHTLSYSPSAKI